jgi:hypothetical protein
MRSAVWELKWSRIASDEDTLLANPLQAIATERILYVLDGQRQNVIGMEAGSGRTLWASGVRGFGPNEIGQIGTIALGHGALLAPDRATSRMLTVDSLGAIGTDAGISRVGRIRSVCATAGQQHLAITESVPALALLSGTDAGVTRQNLPWPEVQSAPMHYHFGLLSPIVGTRSGCVLAMQLADGLARWDGDRWTAIGKFVEPLPPPDTGMYARPPVGAVAISADTASVAVLFGGQSEHALRVIDFYEPASLLYRYSVTAPEAIGRRSTWMTRFGNEYYFIFFDQGLPAVAAFRLEVKPK